MDPPPGSRARNPVAPQVCAILTGLFSTRGITLGYLGDIRRVCEVTKAGDAVYQGQVGQVLDGLCHKWRLMYPQAYSQMYYTFLRNIIGQGLGCECWVEVFAGRSKVVYHGIDVYWKIRSPGMADGPDTYSNW